MTLKIHTALVRLRKQTWADLPRSKEVKQRNCVGINRICEINGLIEGKNEILSYVLLKERSCVKSLWNLRLPASVACIQSTAPFWFLGRNYTKFRFYPVLNIRCLDKIEGSIYLPRSEFPWSCKFSHFLRSNASGIRVYCVLYTTWILGSDRPYPNRSSTFCCWN